MAYDAGAVCVALSAFFFALQAALIKLIDVPPILLLQVRSAALWILSLLVAVFGRRCGLIRSTTPISHLLLGEPGERTWLLLRACGYVCCALLNWTALECLPAGDTTALVQSFLYTNVLARCVLKEPLRPIVALCVLLHLSGIALIARPRFLIGVDSPHVGDAAHAQQRMEGSVAAVCSALFGACLRILTRLAARTHWLAVEHTNGLHDDLCEFMHAPRCPTNSDRDMP